MTKNTNELYLSRTCVGNCQHIIGRMPEIWQSAHDAACGMARVYHTVSMLTIYTPAFDGHKSRLLSYKEEVEDMYEQISRMQQRLREIAAGANDALEEIDDVLKHELDKGM